MTIGLGEDCLSVFIFVRFIQTKKEYSLLKEVLFPDEYNTFTSNYLGVITYSSSSFVRNLDRFCMVILPILLIAS